MRTNVRAWSYNTTWLLSELLIDVLLALIMSRWPHIVSHEAAENLILDCSFPSLLRSLDASKEELNIKGYGLAETTLEEVFLAVNSKGKSLESLGSMSRDLEQTNLAVTDDDHEPHDTPLLRNALSNGAYTASDPFEGDLRRPTKVLVRSQSSPTAY